MSENYDRRSFLGKVLLSMAAVDVVSNSATHAQKTKKDPASTRPASTDAFGDIKQIDAGVLNIGFAEVGPVDGTPVLLLHSWPYDIHTYIDVAPLLAAKGYRVIVPFLRGYGTTRFLSSEAF